VVFAVIELPEDRRCSHNKSKDKNDYQHRPIHLPATAFTARAGLNAKKRREVLLNWTPASKILLNECCLRISVRISRSIDIMPDLSNLAERRFGRNISCRAARR
jgi:hypothetical protein